MQINDVAIVAEVTEQFARYETALMDNDVEALNGFFWRDPLALRYGPEECLYGHDAISTYRAARDASDISRRLEKTAINTFGTDYAVANTEYVRLKTGRHGRQSQTWVRFPEGWRIVAAHVSLMPE